MDTQSHDLKSLFAQLGLPSDALSIDRFIDRHRPLSHTLRLTEAAFWNSSQVDFLREEILNDADWAAAVDELDARLRA